jgi:hypothetical protein
MLSRRFFANKWATGTVWCARGTTRAQGSRTVLRRSVLITGILVLSLADFAWAQTLSGIDVQLRDGSIVPAATPLLSNPSQTLNVERGILGQFAAGHSSGASGVQLVGGVLAVPEPGVGLLLASGLLGLLGLARRRGAAG